MSGISRRCRSSHLLRIVEFAPRIHSAPRIQLTNRSADVVAGKKRALHWPSGASRAPTQDCRGVKASWRKRWGWARRWRCWRSCLRTASPERTRRAAADAPAQCSAWTLDLEQNIMFCICSPDSHPKLSHPSNWTVATSTVDATCCIKSHNSACVHDWQAICYETFCSHCAASI